VIAFVAAHVVAWQALGRGWRGAARAPFVVFPPVAALLLLDAVLHDSYESLPLKIGTLLSWQVLCFFFYACLRILVRPDPARRA
jgi:hypothetical protein